MIIVKDDNKVKVRSEPNGPVEFKTIVGTDNLTTAKPIKWRYKAAKPYTSVQLGLQVSKTFEVVVDGDAETITAPAPHQILQKFKEEAFSSILDTKYAQLDQYADNGAIENSLAYGDLLLYVTASEARQTMIMVGNIFRTLFKAIRDVLRHAKKLNLVATMDTLTDLWLEYRYGWRPFIAECEALAEALTRIRPDGVKSSYGGSKKDNILKKPVGFPMVTLETPEGFIFKYKPKLKIHRRIAKNGFNYLNTESSRNDDWMAILGLDMESILSTAWEMIPFSFVVDMFLNIGSLLETQNSSEQVDSFNYYRSHITNGEFDFLCKDIQRLPYVKIIDIFALADQHGVYLDGDSTDSEGNHVKGRYWDPDGYGKIATFSREQYSTSDKYFVYKKALGYYVDLTYGHTLPATPAEIGWFNHSKYGLKLYSSDGSVKLGDTPSSKREPDPVSRCLQDIDLSLTPMSVVNAFVTDLCNEVNDTRVLWWRNEIVRAEEYDPDQYYRNIRNVLYYSPSADSLSNGNPAQIRAKWFTIGSKFVDQPVVTAKKSKAHYKKVPCTVYTRSLDKNFNHSFTVDADLSAGQVVDLLALGNSMTRRFRT